MSNPLTCDEAGTLMDLVHAKINDLLCDEDYDEAKVETLYTLAKKLEAMS